MHILNCDNVLFITGAATKNSLNYQTFLANNYSWDGNNLAAFCQVNSRINAALTT